MPKRLLRYRLIPILFFVAMTVAQAQAEVVEWINGHAYEFVPGEFTWEEATLDAASRKHKNVQGHLVTITSQEEHDFVVNLIADAGAGATLFWLGASDAEEEGVWRWVAGPENGAIFYTTLDGPLGYANWDEGEPNDQLGGENHALGNWGLGGSWNDGNSGTLLGYVVEFTPDNEEWGTYQGNKEHTGYVARSYDVSSFETKWQVSTGLGGNLNPIAVGGGQVYVTEDGYFSNQGLYTHDADTGELLWSLNYGHVNSVNPPAYDNGNVYIQTGNHSNDTYLRAYSGKTGKLVFQSNHAAQWERYLAPTIVDGVAYINGGYYGGMYAFDSSTGQQLWFANLAQYSDWTPAVDEQFAYAYMKQQLYAADRDTGEISFTIDDPNYDWNGYSMNLAPVLGGANDVFVIQSGRLIRFDLETATISREQVRNFSGQPSIARGVVYAIDSNSLTAWHQFTGKLLWSWAPTQDTLKSPFIVTDTHVFISSDTQTLAVSLNTHALEWSFDQAGHLALANDTLYVASNDGTLTAINLGITTGNTNRAPVIDPIGNHNVIAGELIEFLVAASDLDGDEIVLTASPLPAGATFNGTTGSFSWVPKSNQIGDTIIEFTAADDGTPSLSESIQVVITVDQPLTPVERIELIVESVENMNLPPKLERKLIKKLGKAQKKLGKNKTSKALSKLKDFIARTQSAEAKGEISCADTQNLIDMANQIINSLR